MQPKEYFVHASRNLDPRLPITQSHMTTHCDSTVLHGRMVVGQVSPSVPTHSPSAALWFASSCHARLP
jgi:hypothetical protein